MWTYFRIICITQFFRNPAAECISYQGGKYKLWDTNKGSLQSEEVRGVTIHLLVSVAQHQTGPKPGVQQPRRSEEPSPPPASLHASQELCSIRSRIYQNIAVLLCLQSWQQRKSIYKSQQLRYKNRLTLSWRCCGNSWCWVNSWNWGSCRNFNYINSTEKLNLWTILIIRNLINKVLNEF